MFNLRQETKEALCQRIIHNPEGTYFIHPEMEPNFPKLTAGPSGKKLHTWLNSRAELKIPTHPLTPDNEIQNKNMSFTRQRQLHSVSRTPNTFKIHKQIQ